MLKDHDIARLRLELFADLATPTGGNEQQCACDMDKQILLSKHSGFFAASVGDF